MWRKFQPPPPRHNQWCGGCDLRGTAGLLSSLTAAYRHIKQRALVAAYRQQGSDALPLGDSSHCCHWPPKLEAIRLQPLPLVALVRPQSCPAQVSRSSELNCRSTNLYVSQVVLIKPEGSLNTAFYLALLTSPCRKTKFS